MFSAFKERRPWAAALITFLFDPFIGMLYLNRGLIAVAYFGLELVAVAVLALFWAHNPAALYSYLPWVIYLPFRIAGAIHGFVIARRRSSTESMHWYSRWYAIISIYVFLVAFAFAIRAFLYRPFSTASGSMRPTLNIGDYFFAEKFAYNFSTPQRGDVIVFNVPQAGNVEYVKRVIGIPGDRVQIIKGRVYVNGTAAQLRQIEDVKLDCYSGACTKAHQFIESIPCTHPYHVLKTTNGGPSDDTDVSVVPAGSYFVLGDNRDNSMDSRNGIGFVPASAIVGKAAIKWIDGSTNSWTWRTVN